MLLPNPLVYFFSLPPAGEQSTDLRVPEEKHLSGGKLAGHDSETAPVVPGPTSGESSRKRPIEDEEDLLEDARYQREHALVSDPTLD